MALRNGRWAANNMSNPFNDFRQHTAPPQQTHLQHPTQSLQNQNFGSGGFGGGLGTFPSGEIGGLASAFGSSVGLRGGHGLDSQAARMGFNGATLPQQQHDVSGMGAFANKGGNTRIRDVWKHNLEQEMAVIRSLIDRYPNVSMDTEFPGVVARPMGEFQTKASYHYQTVRVNADTLKIIQLGITLFNADGEVPPANLETGVLPRSFATTATTTPCTWTFNFEFSLEEDMYNEESIQMLKRSGADFDKHKTQGIDPAAFGSLLITSGLVTDDNVNWISFHSGYDFAYLIKIMWARQLPNNEEAYRNIVSRWFPRLLDVKFLCKHARNMLTRGQLSQQAASIITNLGNKNGLQDLADELGCTRVGSGHTAGSDAWLTGSVYFALKEKVFDGKLPDDINGQMWGLTGVPAPASAAIQAAALAAQSNGNPALANPYQPSYHNNAPSTPTNNAAGIASTPGHMTPGDGGMFGSYTHQSRR